MAYKEFQAATSTEPVTFKIGSDMFEAAAQCPAGVLLSMAANSSDEGGAGAVTAAMDFLDAVLKETSRARFAERMTSVEDPISITTVTELVQWLIGVYTGRPTEQPSPSVAGPSDPSESSTAPLRETVSTS